MKQKALALLLASVLIAALFVPSSFGFAQNNDSKYNTYKNMNPVSDGHARYIVPNLYRQDASYTNVKLFPLVVNGGIEYFPLDIFAQYSYLEVVYSKLGYGFYINNTKNNHYVLFDLESGNTSTHESVNVDIKPQIFNQTHYVPAKAVCDLLGMTFETYDDPVGGIRAARISDAKATKTLDELIVMYSPTKILPETSPTDETQMPGTNPTPETSTDPYAASAPRALYLLFTGAPNGYTPALLDTLNANGLVGVFVLEADAIAAHPDTVRRIICEGHLAALAVDAAKDGEVRTAEDILTALSEANALLSLVTKSGARAVYVRGASEELTDDVLAENGYYRISAGIGVGDGAATEAAGWRTLLASFVDTASTHAATRTLRFSQTALSAPLLEKLIAFVGEYAQMTFLRPDEFAYPAA